MKYLPQMNWWVISHPLELSPISQEAQIIYHICERSIHQIIPNIFLICGSLFLGQITLSWCVIHCTFDVFCHLLPRQLARNVVLLKCCSQLDNINSLWKWSWNHMRILDSVFANMRMGILPNLKKTNMCIFHVSLYFCTTNTLFCLKNGIFALEMAFMTQN